jgi:hypothetical protein
MSAAACAPAPARAWRLTADQIAHTLDALVPGAGAGVSDRLRPLQPEPRLFTNEAATLAGSANILSEIFSIAADAAAKMVAQPAGVSPCLATQLQSDTCVKTAVQDFGARAFRRPLDADEVKDFTDFFAAQAQKSTRADALRVTLRRFLVSPYFLFRFEVGKGDPGLVRLTPYEVASEIAYLLLDGPPDKPLLDAANSGALADAGEVARQVQRLIASPTTAPGLFQFVGELVGVDRAAARAPATIANRADVVAAMSEEPRRFLQEVLWKDGHKFATLMSVGYAVVNPTLAAHYGLAAKPKTWERVSLADRPGGLLTLGAPLTARPGTTARGMYIREHFLCQPTPPPPVNVETDLDKQRAKFQMSSGKMLTERQVRELHTSDPACTGCHSLLDPLGFPFDVYDNAGTKVDKIDGQPVDTRGAIRGTSSSDGDVKDAAELLGRLASSPEVRSCFVQHVYQYVHGRGILDRDRCYLDAVTRRFEASGGDLLQLVVDITAQDNFTARAPQEN